MDPTMAPEGGGADGTLRRPRADLQRAAQPPHDEPAAGLMGRTTATVLFTDLVASTELRGRLGEEAADELRRRHDRLLTRAGGGNNGRGVKGLGDGVRAPLG